MEMFPNIPVFNVLLNMTSEELIEDILLLMVSLLDAEFSFDDMALLFNRL